MRRLLPGFASRGTLGLCVILSAAATAVRAYAAQENRGVVTGTVISVRKFREQSPHYTLGGSNPSDAPLTSRYYAFEVAIRVGCEVYVGRYQTPFDYLPSVFTAERVVSFRLNRHVMHFDLESNPDLRMGIVHRSQACGANC